MYECGLESNPTGYLFFRIATLIKYQVIIVDLGHVWKYSVMW